MSLKFAISKKNYLCSLVLLISTFCWAQDFTKCNVFQFSGTDSLNKHIAITQTFNKSGQLILETYKNYKRNSSEGRSDGTYYYYYKDTLLIKRMFVDEKKDTSKMICYYNNENQLIKEEHFNCEKKIRKDVDKGLGRLGGCVVLEEDFEKFRTWEKISEINYSYDKLGRKILYDATKLHFDSQNRYTWIYDDKGRIQKYNSYNNDRLIWIEDYTYTSDDYNFARIWYENGEPTKRKYWEKEEPTIFTFTYLLNKKGNILKEIVTTNKNEIISGEITDYDSKDRVSKIVYLNTKDEIEMTHIFEYK